MSVAGRHLSSEPSETESERRRNPVGEKTGGETRVGLLVSRPRCQTAKYPVLLLVAFSFCPQRWEQTGFPLLLEGAGMVSLVASWTRDVPAPHPLQTRLCRESHLPFFRQDDF